METSNYDAMYAVVYAQNERTCLGPIESSYSGPEVAVLYAKTTGEVLVPERLSIKVALLHAQNHR